jgi:hypothetical protein
MAQDLERAEAELPAIPRDVLRSRRRREVRARTESVKRMTKRELELGRLLFPPGEDHGIERPRTRGDCADGIRPCPFVSCVHHLYLDVSAKTGAIKVNFPDLEPDELAESCALDVADRGGGTLEEVGGIMNLTRERVRQVEVRALARLHAVADLSALRDFVDEGPPAKRRLPVIHRPESEDDDEDEECCAENDNDADEGAGFDVDRFAGDTLAE